MPRVSSTTGNNQRKSNYQKADRTYFLEVLHRDVTRNKRQRVVSLVTFTQQATATDPFTAEQYSESVALSVQVDRPLVGFTTTQIDQNWTGFKTWFDSTMLSKILGGES